MITITCAYLISTIMIFGISLFDTGTRSAWKRNGAFFALMVVAVAIMVYFVLPSRNMLSILLANGVLGLVYYLLVQGNQLWQQGSHSKKKVHRKLLPHWVGWVMAVLVIIALGGELYSYLTVKPTWNSIAKTTSKAKEAPTFKRNETPIAIAPKTVLNRVRKAASDIPHSQYYRISDNVQAQYYQGKPVYVVAVEYAGFWAMVRSGRQIPGYFIIDATSQNATPRFIKQPYRFATSAYFNDDAFRQIYRHNPTWLTMSSPQLEIDNQGIPYWVQTVYKAEVFTHRPNYRRLHVVVMNAQNGHQKTYSLAQMPAFIDEGITSEAAAELNSYYGTAVHGFWNRYFGKADIIKPTNNGPEDGVTSIFNRDGSVSYFTDFTNPNTKADSAMGYSMINARTGHLTYYAASGIMDSSGAKENADQNYKAQQWKAAMPILYNINGRPTWVMTILDKSAAIRGYYYLDAQDQSLHGNGDTPTAALDAFRQSLTESGAKVANTPGAKLQVVTGTADRVALVTNKNKVMFTLKDSATVYTVDTNDFAQANLMRPGDKLKFKALIVREQSIGNVAEFKNESLK
ncbi:hypothetical protein [Ligilactobacillus saerimneri]|uniref:hypothetical protein n=1 Tax=Ligilactobacillus saerimneri TaxID=228229 RepID=UPI00242F468C|nr:hypothetical protein [Ligilactobacillus saerimneri]